MTHETAAIETDADTGALALLARQADSILFDTLDVAEFEELVFYTTAETGALVATAADADTHVRLEVEDDGLRAVEDSTVDPDDLDAIEITDPQSADGEDTRLRRRGD